MWVTVIVAIGALVVVLSAHYWTLWGLAAITPSDDADNHRRSLLMLMLLVSAHLLHIVGYALLLALLIDQGGWGHFAKADADAIDLLYFSSSAYTTLGFADATPQGDLRLISVFEGLAGFMALTWSATFVYSSFKATWRA
ncbi:Ion channel [Methyloligella halotolerans]|uniref:Ion channel n=1 Tax=Methyloligella halotolerans TaxID=1177755 RepID=A0A1E2RZ35_9HYPH|nr:ion channel [Methyloligella halotolerans]ODA67497.1 Ion channel [Methyloligella halotolerans]